MASRYGYVLPPPVGVENDMYHAQPQKADTVFDTFNSRFPDITSNRVSASPVAAQGDYFSPLPDVSQYDYSYLGNNLAATAAAGSPASGANAANTPESLWPSDPGNELPGTSGASSPNPSIGSVIGGMLNGPNGAAGAPAGGIQDTILKLFIRGIVVILGFIFVAVGLSMLGAKTRIGDSVIREVRRSIPR
jgi:hypothetical protein